MSHLDTAGRIFDVQRFSVHDGNGIRTIVFFKGCAFRCPWCCNPESQSFELETMKTADGVRAVGRDVTVRDVMAEVRKDSAYYRRSAGGLTLSGGECLLQPDFARDLLRAAVEEGLSTAIESMASVPRATVAQVLPYLDTYLMDVKHTDAAKHKAFVGKDNALVLENARYVAAHAETELVVRVPVVPTFNDTPAEIAAIARFAASLKTVETMHLLPYHPYGSDKYAALGRTYTMSAARAPSQEKMEVLRQAAVQVSRLNVVIGG
ncbi:MAG: glycyl-radical enzyme activating protein [Clostridiales bacterium]|jgi:pyruvate formate lyase activating enzyme|nr:glycyl-radical enzyme activating protein [Clostridiales bacterium]